MRDSTPNPRALRLRPLCSRGAQLQGKVPLAALTRLGESFVAAADGSASWQLVCSSKAVAGGEAEWWVLLRAEAVVPLLCQRCLAPMAQALTVNRAIRFVEDEDLAARLDEELEDDVLCLPPALDVQALLEDELILGLPLVPKHETSCPQPLLPASRLSSERAGVLLQASPDEPHPFAALEALKRSRAQS
jgi:uncharacterized protein